ncbi:MAG: ParA family protein [Lactobacillaceae bacterium]|jgi:chromosome partitioning protein|nr:ParA family protein [Lactobacillaceae bacterium]
MSKIIVFSNQKGGVGKTTTTLNIAAGLALQKQKVLLIDLDPQGNATSGSGVEIAEDQKDIFDVLVDGADINEAIAHGELFDVVPSTPDLAGAELELSKKSKKQTALKDALIKLPEDQYDFILIDNPPALGLLSLNSLTAANSVIIPVQAEYYALEGLVQLSQTIKLVQEHGNKDLEIEGVLMTMTSRTKLSKQVSEEVSKYFKDKVFNVSIPRNVKLSEAPSFGKAIQEYAPLSPGARAYNKLVKEIIGKNNGKEND